MIPALDIWRSAQVLMKHHGQDAPIEACPSQKHNLGADHADRVPSRGRGEQIRWQDRGILH